MSQSCLAYNTKLRARTFIRCLLAGFVVALMVSNILLPTVFGGKALAHGGSKSNVFLPPDINSIFYEYSQDEIVLLAPDSGFSFMATIRYGWPMRSAVESGSGNISTSLMGPKKLSHLHRSSNIILSQKSKFEIRVSYRVLWFGLFINGLATAVIFLIASIAFRKLITIVRLYCDRCPNCSYPCCVDASVCPECGLAYPNALRPSS